VYREHVEALDMAISALEKQEQKTAVKIAPFGGGDMLNTCPICGHILQTVFKYCPHCGQHIKAEEES
jgi:rubrerythrin